MDLQFKSEGHRSGILLKQDSSAIGFCHSPLPLLPASEPDLKAVLDLTEQWNMLNKDTGSMLVTGVTWYAAIFSGKTAPLLELHKGP